MTLDLAREGFRTAPTRAERVFEAANLFEKGRNGGNFAAASRLQEAFTTSDFPVLLGDAFQKQAVAAQKAAVREFEAILTDVKVDRFGEHKLIDLWGDDAFELVHEGEEYKGATLNETDLTHSAQKHGRVYGLTWELIRDRRFSDLARFPFLLGNGSVKGENRAVASLLATGDGWNTTFFGEVDTTPLTWDALQTAHQKLAGRRNHRGELVTTSGLILVVGPALAFQARRLVNATLITEGDGSKGNPRVEQANPWAGTQVVVSDTLGSRLGSIAGTGWALVQGKDSDLPSIIRTKVSGEENLDIRVKKDQGASIGGGDLPVEAGSFKDDTIWYRGRDVYGIDPGFTTGVYASTGAGA